MGIVVQKYGGSSVADATGIKRVAQRIVATRKAGNDVVVVVSAMGDTTDELRDLAEQVTPLPPPRELDMLLTAGERISMALVAMAIAQLGHKAKSFTGSQAGVITDSAHGKAKIIDITPGRIETALQGGAIAIVAGFQGVSQDTKDITTLGRGRLRHHRGGPGRRPRRGRLRDLQRRRRRVHRRPPDRPVGPQAGPRLHRGDARDGGVRRQDPAPAVRRVRPPLRHADPRPLLLLHQRRAPGSCPHPRKGTSMEQAIIAGVAHDRSEAKITVVGVPDKVGEAARIFEALAATEVNIDMVVQNVSAAATGRTDISFTLPRRTARPRWAPSPRLQDVIGFEKLLYDDQIGKVSLIGRACARTPASPPSSSPRLPGPA